MGILGSLPILGNWDENKAFKLIWSNGHVWKGEIPVNIYVAKGFEFKFIIIQDKKVKTWENGENNKFDYDGFINEIKANKKGFYDKYEYEYNNNNIINKKLFKKNNAKLIDKDLFNQHNKKKKFDIFANYSILRKISPPMGIFF